jgi:hypothetical protein
MADEYDDDVPEQESDNANIRQLREKAKRADELQAQLADLQRKEAFRSAGIDPADKRAGYFVKGYEGDLDPEAIRTAATEAGFLNPPQTDQPTNQAPDDSTERIFTASAGATGPPSSTDWASAMAEAERITDPVAREDAILNVVERHGGTTTRQLQ